MLTELDRSMKLTEQEKALVRLMRNARAAVALAVIALFAVIGVFGGPDAPVPSRAAQDAVAPDRGLMTLEHGGLG
jgi:hypothetical protein